MSTASSSIRATASPPQDWADKAKAAGIPIASMGVFVGDPKKHQPPWVYPALVGFRTATISTKAYAIGKIAVADNPNGGKVAIVEGLPGFAAVLFRTQGFEKALKEFGKDLPGDRQTSRQLGSGARASNLPGRGSGPSRHQIMFVARSGDGARMPGGGRSPRNPKPRSTRSTVRRASRRLIRAGEPIVTTCANPETSGYQATAAVINYARTKKTARGPLSHLQVGHRPKGQCRHLPAPILRIAALVGE